MISRLTLFRLVIAIGLVLHLSFSPTWAQDVPVDASEADEQAPSFEMLEGLEDFGDLGGFLDDGGGELTLSGELKLGKKGSRDGILEIRAKLASEWHVYAMDQKGGPGPAKISVKSPESIQTTGPFRADREPKVREVEYFEVPLREHYEEVVWTAPIRLAEGVDPETVELDVQFDGQICSDEAGCKPMFGEPIPVTFGGYLEPAPAADQYRADRSYVTIQGHIEPSSVAPGGKLQLLLTATADSGWHVYAYASRDPEEIAKPTLIVLTEPSSWVVGQVQSSSQPVTKQATPDEPAIAYHDGAVTWTVDIDVPDSVTAGDYEIAGLIGYQTCTETSCDRPRAAKFTATVTVGDASSDQPQTVSFAASSYGEAARLAAADGTQAVASEDVTPAPGQTDIASTGDTRSDTDASAAESAGAETSETEKPKIDFWMETFKKLGFTETELGWEHSVIPLPHLNAGMLKVVAVLMAMVSSFLAGMVLNVMPCVLPVIGLKLMSFINQGGEERWRILSLNLWYSLGMWLVFMVFAVVAAVLHLMGETFAWGEHLGDPRFSIPLLLVVFTLGLSMFGVWEIPIPGFVGGGKANELATKEGPGGALFKGILTTVLATPCSGPFIGVAVGIAVIAPLWLNFSMFTAMAMGMASPYLLIGAFPKLIKWLPKPGEWMETFKEAMGFILMGTGVWIVYFLESRFTVPVLSLLIGVAAACWVVGRTPMTATPANRLRNWGWAVVFAGCGLILFATFLPPPSDDALTRHVPAADSPELPWELYTPDSLQRYRDQGKTVMVDFTADW